MDKADRCYRKRMAYRTQQVEVACLEMYAHAGLHGCGSASIEVFVVWSDKHGKEGGKEKGGKKAVLGK